MKLNRYIVALGGMLSLLAPQAEAVIMSVKSLGMGGVGISYAKDALAAGFNPATAADVENRADLGITYANFKGKTEFQNNRTNVGFGPLNPLVNGSRNPYHKSWWIVAPDFGINYNLGGCGCESNWYIGLVSYNRNYSKVTYKDPLVLIGTTPGGLEYINQTVSPYVAYKWNCMNFGISLNWQIARIKVNGFQNFDEAPQPFEPGSVAPGAVTNRGYNYSNGLGVTLGWQWHITDDIAVGLTYQPRTKMSRFNKYRGFIAQHGRFNIPQKVGFGISWRFTPCATVAFDIEHIQWSKIPAVANPVIGNQTRTLPSPPFPPNTVIPFPNSLGGNNGPGFGWKSQTYYRVGVEWVFNDCWTFRAGFRHVNMPIRRSQTALNALTLETLEDIVLGGATYKWDCSNEISGFFGWGFNKRIKGSEDSIPQLLGGGQVNFEQRVWVVGLSWGRMF
jgi:long-chain fatty acid transport protein